MADLLRGFGAWQWAGFKVATTSAANLKNDNTDALLQSVSIVDPAAPTVPLGTAAAPLVTTSSGSGSAVTIADGADVTQGAKADAAITNPATSGSVVSFLKGGASLTGALTETAPATDTASSGLNGRLQRIAQRLTTLITSGFTGPTTGTESNVASSGASGVILASNVARRGATIFNDSSQILYLLLGSATASTSVYSAQLAAGGYYEVPFGYTGQLTGIWASANGFARVTELA